MKRIGKFYVNGGFLEDGDSADIFVGMRFVPYRVEHLYAEDVFECIGESPLFDLLDRGLHPPEYEITIDNGAVSVKRSGN